MFFEVHYLVVFRPDCPDPRAILESLLKHAYEDELGESPDDDFAAVRMQYKVERWRENGQKIIAFRIFDDMSDEEALRLSATFGDKLSEETTSIEHVLKFIDSFQYNENQEFLKDIYHLEMRLREVLSFIFVEFYGANYYNLLGEITTQPMMKTAPTEDQMRAHRENEFFFLTFNQYVNLNERKLPPAGKPLYELINLCGDFKDLQAKLSVIVIENEDYSEFLARIRKFVEPIENLRNSVAHNRAISKKVRADYLNAKPLLLAAIDEFFEKANGTPNHPPEDPAGDPPPHSN